MATILSILAGFGIFIGILIGLFALELIIVALIPGFKVPEQHLERAEQPTCQVDTKPPSSRKDVIFKVNGTSLSAWLYLPKDLSAPVSCIIMGNGFGGTKEGLEPYAVRYQEAGFAALVFDYRHFGQSDGEPRQLLWIPYQLEDYTAAINYARNLEEIDSAKIALWGTSMSGGHAIVVAAKNKNITCVVSQCPGLDGFASAKMAFKREGINFRLIMHAQRDLVRSWLGLSPHKIPIVGKPGSIACFTSLDAHDGYKKLMPASYVNEVCARIVIRGDKYRPVKHARDVRCPMLLQICDHDSITPSSAAKETEEYLGKYAEVKHYPIGHFDIYVGDNFEKSVRDQLEFFNEHL